MVTPDMKAFRGFVSIKIRDPKQNVIAQLLNQTLTKGKIQGCLHKCFSINS